MVALSSVSLSILSACRLLFSSSMISSSISPAGSQASHTQSDRTSACHRPQNIPVSYVSSSMLYSQLWHVWPSAAGR